MSAQFIRLARLCTQDGSHVRGDIVMRLQKTRRPRRKEPKRLIATVLRRGQKKRIHVAPEHVQRRRVRDAYIDNRIEAHKLSANYQFVSRARKLGPEKAALVLDTPKGLTSSMLAVAGWDRQRIIVPNPNAKTPLCTHHKCTVFEYLRDEIAPLEPAHRPSMHVFLDYCCTWRGCTDGTRPQNDIELLFWTGVLPRHGGVLAITLSPRGVHKSLAKHAREVDTRIRALATQYGYDLALAHVAHPKCASGVQMLLWITPPDKANTEHAWVRPAECSAQPGPWYPCTIESVTEEDGCMHVTVRDTDNYVRTGKDTPDFVRRQKACPIPTALNRSLKALHIRN
jgi:hypothetical protein